MARFAVVTLAEIHRGPCPNGHTGCLSARCWVGNPQMRLPGEVGKARRVDKP